MRNNLIATLTTIILIACFFLSPAWGQESVYDDDNKVKPERNGFTLELGIGGGFTHIIPSEGESLNKIGIAPLSLSLGWFINNNLSVMFRMAGTAYFQNATLIYKDGREEEELLTGVLGFYGIHAQYWFNDWFFVSGGPGLALTGLMKGLSTAIESYRGFCLGLRAGISAVTWRNHSLGFSLELFPSFYEGRTVMAEAIKLEWQWF